MLERIKQYLAHLPTCNLNIDWTEAHEATSLLPDSTEKHNHEEHVRQQMHTCTCGLHDVVSALEASIIQ